MATRCAGIGTCGAEDVGQHPRPKKKKKKKKQKKKNKPRGGGGGAARGKWNCRRRRAKANRDAQARQVRALATGWNSTTFAKFRSRRLEALPRAGRV